METIKLRKVKTAGYSKELYVDTTVIAKAGKISDGVVFVFQGEGAWLIDLKDLKKIVHEVEMHRKRN